LGRGQCVEGFGSKAAFYLVLEAVGRLCRGPDGARVVDTLAVEAPTWLVQFPALLTRQWCDPAGADRSRCEFRE
jgi:hypothetical protein